MGASYRMSGLITAAIITCSCTFLSFAENKIEKEGSDRKTQPTASGSSILEADIKAFIEKRLYTREEIDEWLTPKASAFSVYDNLMGYRNSNREYREGLDNSWVQYHYDERGARRMIMYADQLCRINTYGSSFTDCEQVNDGETWQERLAAHLGEPVRNYGIGGLTAYQAYVRMQREEIRTPAKYIILNLTPPYERHLFGWQSFFYSKSPKHPCPPLPHVRSNKATGQFEERPNACPTPESLYNLCNLDWVYNTFKDDFMLQIGVARENLQKGSPQRSYEPISRLAEHHGIRVNIKNPDTLADVLDTLVNQEAVYSTVRTLEKVRAFAEQNNKTVLYVFSYASDVIEHSLNSGQRFDQDVVNYLREHRLPYVDMMAAYIRDSREYALPFNEYQKLHFLGHPSPLGNFFFAYSIKNKLAEIMDPKPLPYREK